MHRCTSSVEQVVTHEHEAPLRLLQDNPKLATELYCGLLGQRLPDYTSVKEGSEAMTRSDKPDKRDCDNLDIYYRDEEPVFALIVEVQRAESEDKWFSWPDYLIAVRSRLRCPVALVVICPDLKTAKWAMAPIETGHAGFTLVPFVIGPDLIPVVTDPAEVRGCEQMALLSAMAHGDGAAGVEVIEALLGVLVELPEHLKVKYTRIAINTLSDKALERLEAAIMTDTARRVTFIDRAEARGEAKGESRMLLRILEKRGISVDTATEARIVSCTDLDQLDRWGDRALEIERVEELFD
jgi:hypothetical protein